MKGIVDYGGSSEDSDGDAEGAPATDFGAELRARIPEARGGASNSARASSAGLQRAEPDAIPKRHDWELEMERELKKGVVRTAASGAKRPRARIPALPNFNVGSEKTDAEELGDPKRTRKLVDAAQTEESSPSTQSSSSSEPKHGLLALLPQPKSQSSSTTGVNNKSQLSAKAATILLPPSIARAGLAKPPPKPPTTRPLVQQSQLNEASEEEDSDGEEDYFGLRAGLAAKSPAVIAPSHPTYSLPPINPHVFMDEVEAGPSRPTPLHDVGPHLPSAVEPSSLSSSSSKQRGKRGRAIDDHEACRLIYEKELAPHGAGSRETAAMEVESMVEVSVDQALGPNVRENLLRNLNNKALAQVAAGPLPKVKKDPAMKLAKMKHQITHLAGLAVSREEQLQEKWAENRAKKRQSAQKYGF